MVEGRDPAGRVRCGEVREAVSAGIDGEDAGLAAELVDHHLDSCADCARFAAGAATVSREVRRTGMDAVPDLAPGVLAALADRRTLAPDRRHRDLRLIVAAAGVAQLLMAMPALFGTVTSDVHLGREIGALQLALGVGLVLAALQPRRAAGVLPIAAVVATATAVGAVVDVATGAATALGELVHLAEVVGVLALWRLTRRRDRDEAGGAPGPVHRLRPTLRPIQAR